MTTLMAQSSNNDLLDAVTDLDGKEFERFVAQVLALQARRRSHTLTHQEAALLQQINLGIEPETWQRYNALKAKRRAATLTATEHDKLIAISNQIEIANARRIAALSQLATLRRTSLEAVMDQLGIKAPDVE
jgi:CBS-domain-containing membrane protein